MHGKLKKREKTSRILIIYKNLKEATLEEIEMNAKRKGYLFFPYHFFIDCDGNLFRGREEDAVASSEFDNNLETLAVLVDTPSKDKLLLSQKRAIADIVKPYGDIAIDEE